MSASKACAQASSLGTIMLTPLAGSPPPVRVVSAAGGKSLDGEDAAGDCMRGGDHAASGGHTRHSAAAAASGVDLGLGRRVGRALVGQAAGAGGPGEDRLA